MRDEPQTVSAPSRASSIAASPTPMMRELAQRTDGGITVRLLWDGAEKVYLQLWDLTTEAIEEFPVPRESALDAFEHPFRYGPATDTVRI